MTTRRSSKSPSRRDSAQGGGRLTAIDRVYHTVREVLERGGVPMQLFDAQVPIAAFAGVGALIPQAMRKQARDHGIDLDLLRRRAEEIFDIILMAEAATGCSATRRVPPDPPRDLAHEKFKLSLPEWHLLAFVARFSPMRFSEVTHRSGMDTRQVSRTLRVMARRGLTKTRAIADRGSRPTESLTPPMMVSITSKGVALYHAVLHEAQVLSVPGNHDFVSTPGKTDGSYRGTEWKMIRLADETQGSVSMRTQAREGAQVDVDFVASMQGLDEYEAAAVKRLLSTDLRALVGVARQENATERLVQLLRALAPEDPLAAIKFDVATSTVGVRLEFLEHVPVLTSAEVHARAGFPGGNPSQTALRWRKPGKIFAITHGGRELYPAFQFDAEGRPLPIIAQLLAILRQDADRSDWDKALWFIGESGWLDGKTPLECLHTDPDAVKQAAQQEVLPA